MKRILLLFTFLASLSIAQAQDLIIETSAKNPYMEVLNEARIDPVTNNIGNTSGQTLVYIGEVDFSENYLAAGLTFAQGWGGNGNFAVLWAGDGDYESAHPFTQIALAHTQSYSNYVQLAGNMGYNVSNPEDLSGGRLAVEGLTFVKPTGVKKVYLTFVGGAGNVRSVNFYKNAFSPADFHAEGGWEPRNGQLLRPNEKSDYNQVSTRLSYENSELESSPSSETRKDGDGGWGWTTEGVVVNYGTLDFGNGDYKQVCGYVSHWSNQPNDKLEVYIDDASVQSNMIASIFTGMELRDNRYPKAQALNQVVTGQHTVFVKWRGGSTNLTHLDFLKAELWPNEPDPDYPVLVKINDTPTENAKCYTMRNDVPAGAIKIQNHAALNQAQPDGGGNYGWTNSKSVLKLENIDFEDGRFNKIRLNYSTGNDGWIDYKEFANISLYIDLEEGGKTYDWNNAHEELAGVEPIAVVRHQATGGWGNQLTISDGLKSVTGVHTVYVVYYQKFTNEGANIFDYYLDVAPEFEVSAVDKKSVFEEGSLKNSYKNQLTLSVKEENKGIKFRSLYRTNQLTGEKVTVATINFTNNGANYNVVYSNPMATTDALRYDAEPYVLSGSTAEPVVLTDYFAVSTADGGDKAGAYVYSLDYSFDDVNVPVYAATTAAKVMMEEGKEGYTLDEITGDVKHTLNYQNGFAISVPQVSAPVDGAILYRNHNQVGELTDLSASKFVTAEVRESTVFSAAVKVGDNTYGTNQVAVHATLANATVTKKNKSEFSFNNGSHYFDFLLDVTLTSPEVGEFETTGGGVRVWRTCETADEMYEELANRATDYLFYENMNLEGSSMGFTGIGGEKQTFNDGSRVIEYTASTFGSSAEHPQVSLRVRAYYKKASANKVKALAEAASEELYYVAEAFVEVDFTQNVVTGLYEVSGVREIKDVKYYNVAGQQSAAPHKGMNIVVTTYTDGTSSTRKLVK
ncbi:MAG: carbohydrate-binding protein [Muribaculaceae bacterium]|nr:carbohydrate-binding protein [Muribaculaceae bacterium]